MGQYNKTSQKKVAFTKWCPAEDGVKGFQKAQAAVELALSRLAQTTIDLMQCQCSCFPIFGTDK